MTLMSDFAALADLKKQSAKQQAVIDALLRSQDDLDARIRAASAIKEVTSNGVALTATVASLKRVGGYVSTVGIDKRRTVDVYQKRGAHHKGWAVKINEYVDFESTFYGGKVLGLTVAWSRAEAVRVALAWLTSGKILKE